MFDLFGGRRRRALREQPFPPEWEAILARSVPVVERLPAEDAAELRGHILVFCAEKHFEAAGGLELDDTIRVTIAAQACLLLLRREVDEPYPELDTVLVYPRGWRTHAKRAQDGLVTEGVEARLGESWNRGLVVLAWDAARRGAADEDDGQNVILHEFAHQLDTEAGAADGAPDLDWAQRGAWARVLGREFAALTDAIHTARPAFIDDYGATNPAEFFAVVTELFFERPRRLKDKHPALYEQLAAFYKQDPAAW